nr:ABC transporter G family member 32 [Tanacetum cinerariifolium]
MEYTYGYGTMYKAWWKEDGIMFAVKSLGGSQTVVSEERSDKDGKKNGECVVIQLREFLEHSGSFIGNNIHQRGMVLPFQPLSMAFNNISYYELKQEGVVEDHLQLLVNVTGAFVTV